MSAATTGRTDDLVARLVAQVDPDDDRHEDDIARDLVRGLRAAQARTLAVETVARAVWRERRMAQHRIEEAAARPAPVVVPPVAPVDYGDPCGEFARLLADPGLMYAPAGSRNGELVSLGRREERESFRSWAGDRFPDWRERAQAVVEAHPDTPDARLFGEDWHPDGPAAHQRERNARRIAALVESVARETELRVTRDLLDSVFALGDGTRTTWGRATVAEHEQRAELLERNATAGVEGAARHRAAVALLRDHGVASLAELGTEPADQPAVARAS